MYADDIQYVTIIDMAQSFIELFFDKKMSRVYFFSSLFRAIIRSIVKLLYKIQEYSNIFTE